MKHKVASKIVVLSMLLALIFSAVGAKPAQAAGIITHDEIVGRAINIVRSDGYTELADLLTDYQGAANYGSMFPDWGYNSNTENANLAEIAHDTGGLRDDVPPTHPFRDALLSELLPAFRKTSRTANEDKALAFLFGVISHQEADIRWHFDQNGQDAFINEVYHQDGTAHIIAEVCGDYYVWKNMNPTNLEGWYPVETVQSAYGDIGYTVTMADLDAGSGRIIGYFVTETTAAALGIVTTCFFYDWLMSENLSDYPQGGIQDGANRTAIAWEKAWDIMSADVRYVTSTGNGDCLSWATACTLSDALSNPISGQEIWVATGTYKPSSIDRAATFQLSQGVAVYGGFAGTETMRNQRNPAANVTTLSGDIGTPGNNSDNSYHVVTANGINGATLDGFTISGGNANGAAPQNKGGGMYNYGSSPTVTNVTFSGNTASMDGGGMYVDNASSPTVTNVTFSGNWAIYGGGMYNNSNSSPTVTNVTFSDNTADDSGGGMFNNRSSPTVTNVTFSANKATRGKGGGMYNYGSSPTVTNVIFSGNTASMDGGGITPFLKSANQG